VPAPRPTPPAPPPPFRIGDVSLRKKNVGSPLRAGALVLGMSRVAGWGTLSASRFAAAPLEHDVRPEQGIGRMRVALSQAQYLGTASLVAPSPQLAEQVLEERSANLAELTDLAGEYRTELAPDAEAVALVADDEAAVEDYLAAASATSELMTS